MGEKGKSLVESMKERISRSGSKKTKIFYLKKDGKCRVRFLQDMEEGFMVQFHDKFGEFNHVCQKYFGKDCPNCKNKEARTSDHFVWSIWNYETKRVELFCYKANKASPIPVLVSMYDNYGTICDRDYVIQRNGSGFETNYSVVPMDKKKFKGEEEAFSKKKALKILAEAYPLDEDYDEDERDDEDEDEDEEYEAPKKKAKKSKKVVEEEDEDFDEDEEEDEDEDEEEEDEEEEEEKPKKKTKKAKKETKKKSKKKVEEDEDDEDDLPPWEDEDEEDDE